MVDWRAFHDALNNTTALLNGQTPVFTANAGAQQETETEALLDRIEAEVWTKRVNLKMYFQDLDTRNTLQVSRTQMASVLCQNVDIKLDDHERDLLFEAFRVVEPWPVGPTNRFDYKRFVLRVDRSEIA